MATLSLAYIRILRMRLLYYSYPPTPSSFPLHPPVSKHFSCLSSTTSRRSRPSPTCLYASPLRRSLATSRPHLKSTETPTSGVINSSGVAKTSKDATITPANTSTLSSLDTAPSLVIPKATKSRGADDKKIRAKGPVEKGSLTAENANFKEWGREEAAGLRNVKQDAEKIDIKIATKAQRQEALAIKQLELSKVKDAKKAARAGVMKEKKAIKMKAKREKKRAEAAAEAAKDVAKGLKGANVGQNSEAQAADIKLTAAIAKPALTIPESILGYGSSDSSLARQQVTTRLTTLQTTGSLASKPEIRQDSDPMMDATRRLIESSSLASLSSPSPLSFSGPTTIHRNAPHSPSRIDRNVYRTILDWSVHSTVQPIEFNTMSTTRSMPLQSLSQSLSRILASSSSSSSSSASSLQPPSSTSAAKALSLSPSSVPETSYIRAFSSKHDSGTYNKRGGHAVERGPNESESTSVERGRGGKSYKQDGSVQQRRSDIDAFISDSGSLSKSRRQTGLESLEQQDSRTNGKRRADVARKILYDSLEEDWKRGQDASTTRPTSQHPTSTSSSTSTDLDSRINRIERTRSIRTTSTTSTTTAPVSTESIPPINPWKSSRRKIGFGSLDEDISSEKKATSPRRSGSWDDRFIDRDDRRASTYQRRGSWDDRASDRGSDRGSQPSRLLAMWESSAPVNKPDVSSNTNTSTKSTIAATKVSSIKNFATTPASNNGNGNGNGNSNSNSNNNSSVSNIRADNDDTPIVVEDIVKAPPTSVDYLYTPRAILPALETKVRSLYKLYYASELSPATNTKLMDRRNTNLVRECVDAARAGGVEVVRTTRRQLHNLSGSLEHQNVVLSASVLSQPLAVELGRVDMKNDYVLAVKGKTPIDFNGNSFLTIKEPGPVVTGSADEPTQVSATTTAATITDTPSTATATALASTKTETLRPAGLPPIWIVMEDVLDPKMMGEVVRSALHLGIDGILYKKADCTSPNGDVSAASHGVLERRPIYPVQSLVRFVQASSANGWDIVGAHVTYGTPRVRPIYTWPVDGPVRPTLLVIPSDGRKLSKQIMAKCNYLIQVPTLSRIVSSVDSLEPSVLVGVAMATLTAGKRRLFEQDPGHLKRRQMEWERWVQQEQENEKRIDLKNAHVSRETTSSKSSRNDSKDGSRGDASPDVSRKSADPEPKSEPEPNQRPRRRVSSKLAW